ncbi:hypothetical protein OROMI_017977 [Orobanche minor]
MASTSVDLTDKNTVLDISSDEATENPISGESPPIQDASATTNKENPRSGSSQPIQNECATNTNPTSSTNVPASETTQKAILHLAKQIFDNVLKYTLVEEGEKGTTNDPAKVNANDRGEGSSQPENPLDNQMLEGSNKSYRDAFSREDDDTRLGTLDFSDLNPTAVFTKEECVDVSEYYKFALIGKFTYGKPSNQVISQQLKSDGFGLCKVQFLNGKHVLINLTCKSLCDKLWMKREYNVSGFPMRLFLWSPSFDFKHEPALVPVWFRMDTIPKLKTIENNDFALEKPVRVAAIRLCLFFNEICSKTIDVSRLPKIQSDLIETLCELEKYFPLSFFDIMVHLTVHLVRQVELCGPVRFTWMYPFERYMKVCKGYVRNRTRPEGCIAECYIAEEAVEFLAELFCDERTVGMPSAPITLDRRTSGATVVSVYGKLYDQAHLCVLQNTDEFRDYFNEHWELLKLEFPRYAKDEKWLTDKQNKTFDDWVKARVATQLSEPGHKIPEIVRWLSDKPSNEVPKFAGYKIRGTQYTTKERDDMRLTQNSGVYL